MRVWNEGKQTARRILVARQPSATQGGAVSNGGLSVLAVSPLPVPSLPSSPSSDACVCFLLQHQITATQGGGQGWVGMEWGGEEEREGVMVGMILGRK